jgi:hypothetical protein
VVILIQSERTSVQGHAERHRWLALAWRNEPQLTNGVYGPLIVLPAGEKFDPASDLPFVFSIGDFGALGELALINGSPQNKTLTLQAGKKYHFRFINISTNNQGMQVSLSGSSGPVEWIVLAKDGLSLPEGSAGFFPESESGYTGPDLINRNQPFFTLASTNLSEADARSLLTSCFGAGTQEVKFVKLAKSERGRAAIRIYHLSKLAVPFFSRLRHRLALC